MERIHTQSNKELLGGTIGDDLDQLEILTGKIGLNTKEQALSILSSLDSVYERIKRLEDGPSLQAATGQYDGIRAKLEKEAAGFLRDLGGAAVLQKARSQVNPPQDHPWWYLDVTLANRRKNAIKRFGLLTGAVLIGLFLLGFAYQKFLAPPANISERYSREQAAGDALMAGDLDRALQEVDAGLLAVPQDPSLLVLKGVVLDGMGKVTEAQEVFKAAEDLTPNKDEFYITRGQYYSLANQMDKALSDAQAAIAINPDSAQGFLLAGQVYEFQKKYQDALDAYDQAFEVSDKEKQYELSALAKVRIAMLMQSMNVEITPPDWLLTPTPTP